MGIALVIVGGLVLMTVAASVFGYLGEKRKHVNPELEAKVAEIGKRLSALELRLDAKEERFEELQHDVEFVHKLLSDKRP